MSSNVQDCERCGTAKQMCWSLELKSDEKSTILMLCNICMTAARLCWQNFMKEGKPSSQLPELTDDCLMYFGKYKDKPMKEVPADYLIWIADQSWINSHPRLARYINKNRAGLEEEIAENE